MSNNYSAISQFTGVKSTAVTPSDTTVLACAGLYVTTGGTVVMEFEDGATDTWTVPSFFIIPLAVRRVRAASTATGIKAIY
jgi:hypothetical protein